MNLFLKTFYSLLLSVSICLAVFSSALSYASAETSDVKDSLNKLDAVASSSKIINKTPAEGGVPQNIYQITGKIISAGLATLTVIFFIITIYGGLIWMSAFGNEEKAEKASQTLSHAGIGLGVTLIAYLLTNYVVLKIVDIVTNK